MSEFFISGEEKERSGIYKRYENNGNSNPAGAEAGIALALVTGTWGPLNTPVEIDTVSAISTAIGTGTGANVLTELFNAGVQTVKVCRVGNGGAAGSLVLKDDAKADMVTLTAKCPGSRALSVSVKPSLYDDTIREIDIYDGTTLLETYKISIDKKEADGLVKAMASSAYLVATKTADGSGALATITQAPLDGGTDPTVDAKAYSAAANACENERFNMLVTDSEDTAVHSTLQAFVDRMYQDGDYPMAIFGVKSSKAYDDRIKTSMSFNDEKIHYLFDAWKDASGTNYEGYLGAARVGGMICAGASNVSLTNTSIKGAVELSENLTNSQIIKALRAGAILITKNKNGNIVIEKGINTLTNPSAEQDEGWKKIRRVKERFELFDRVDRTLEPMRAKLDNSDDGRAAVIAAIYQVIDAMVGEKKLDSGAQVVVDPAHPPKGDSAWFNIQTDDLDSLERMYLTYKFRFSKPATTEE